jgi:hypothetical protein
MRLLPPAKTDRNQKGRLTLQEGLRTRADRFPRFAACRQWEPAFLARQIQCRRFADFELRVPQEPVPAEARVRLAREFPDRAAWARW